ncbi:DNA polymerase III subunit gamma/tau [Nostoc sp. 'Peltigera membranacea cyanobiont' 232]|uniref:DNA polymerase III subunit gamma/tau n=1 Tax=Nostoc sp. 'Peltigera membranacea cyanobiont' 232 TaxID=2014531 RepID=UPI000B954ACC|nr:DNA polymerase III subunit gamma/tau [Nostoc sp. 'Peltigera membranacea cyanobiont' 232]OYE02186.1 DNA polymerase III subunit gamma/tau [Nostoc sp. 'Peltigera membranacea cyanobiont' 232]
MSTVALHQKYRPQTIAELVGQPYIKTALTNAVKYLQIAPAYLFTGSRGTGKTSTARIFAKSLNCLNTKKPTDQPCGICQSCRSIETSNSLDVSEIDAASNNGVDDARALIERSTLAPVAGRYRIFILDECHCLTGNAFNALLKCIEEPPPHVVFILCTTELHKVLPTIVSRCQVFNFRTLSVQAIVQHLRIIADAESISIDDQALTAIARLSDGGLRDALQLLGQVSLLDEDITANHVMEIAGGVTETELMSILQAISTNNTFNLLQVARVLVDSGKTPKLILSNLLQTYRDLLIIKSAPKEQSLLTGCVSYAQLKVLANHWNFETLNLSLTELQKAENYLRYTVNAAVWLEVCLLNLIPSLLPVSATKTLTVKPVDDKLLPTVAAQTTNLAQIWQQVMDTAKPSNQKLLAHAHLVKLQGDKAILEVTPAYLNKFESSKEAIAKMLQRATQSQQPMTVLIKTANKSSNGRVKA